MIALTGHTGHVGKIIQRKYEVIGFSRSTGHDIRTNRSQILALSKDANVFINCAHGGPGFAQTEMFWDIFNLWKDTDKVIVNIGTASADYSMWSTIRQKYSSEKAALIAAVEEAQQTEHICKVSIINPYIITEDVADDLLTAIDFCINSKSEVKSINLQ